MKEIRQIVSAYERHVALGKKMALATVVQVEGSSYRRAGARMLMVEDGHWTGAISGGCLEGDALRRARKAILHQQPTVVTYDTMEDASAQALGVGLGCNGIIDVLIEPIDERISGNHLEMLNASLDHHRPSRLATVYQSGVPEIAVGDQLRIGPNQEISGSLTDTSIGEQIRADLAAVEKPQSVSYLASEGTIEVFLEVIHPPIRLVIFGGGYDAVHVTRLASELGWHITVTDDCMAKALPPRFPLAHTVVHILREEIREKVDVTPYTAAILMSHNYAYDLAVLRQLLTEELPYIGILGPKKRFDKMCDALQMEGVIVPVADIHSPIGLDIGAETPDEIALAILAEIQAVFAQRRGGMLKDRIGTIHERG